MKITHVSMTQDIDTAALFCNPPNGGERLTNVGGTNAAALASSPSPRIYLDDLENLMHAVSTKRLIVHREHYLPGRATGLLHPLAHDNH